MGTAIPPRIKAPAFNPAASAQARLEASEVARAQQPGFGEPSVAPMDTAEPSPNAPSLTAQLDQAGTFGHQFGQMTPPPASSEPASTMGNGLLGNLAQARPQTIPPVQAKLTIGAPGDKFEQEADQMAARVVAMPDSTVQRQGMPEEEEDELAQAKFQVQRQEMLQQQEEETLQTKPQLQAKDGALEAPANFEGQLAQHKGSGQPLSDETLAFMEPRFGADFSNVRVHETPDLANAIQAQAFTHGQDIYFNSGKYNSESSGEKELLAHELTHVVQQRFHHATPSTQRQRENSNQSLSSPLMVKVLVNQLNVRKSPSRSASRVGSLTRGEKVLISKRFDKDWLEIEFRGEKAFIYEGNGGWIESQGFSENEKPKDSELNKYVKNFRLIGPKPLKFFRIDREKGAIGSTFKIRIKFNPKCNPEKIEYRQYIKGKVLLIDNHDQSFDLGDRFAIPAEGLKNSWQEDGNTGFTEDSAYRYGHRDSVNSRNDKYLPNRKTGHIYSLEDYPNLEPIPAASGDAGDKYIWKMYFRGVILYEGHKVVQEKHWSIQDTIAIPSK